MILITILCISSVSVVSANSLNENIDNNLTGSAVFENMDLERSSPSLNENQIDSLKESMDDDSPDLKNSNHDSKILTDGEDEEEPDTPDLNQHENSDEINYVYPSNINKYFTNGVLDPKYRDKTLVFIGDFENLGKLTINSPNLCTPSSSI